jgi:hypothetical protein
MPFCLVGQILLVSVRHTNLGGAGAAVIAAFPPPPAAPAPHPDFSLKYASITAVGRPAHRFVGFLAHRP